MRFQRALELEREGSPHAAREAQARAHGLAIARSLRQSNPFYRELYRGQSLESWESLPVIDKRSISARLDELLAPSLLTAVEIREHLSQPFGVEKTLAGRYLAFESSGSSGVKSTSVYNLFDFGRSVAAFYQKSVRPFVGERSLVYIGVVHQYNGGNQWMFFLRNLMEVQLLSIFESTATLLDQVLAIRPGAILTKPHCLRALGELAAERGVSLQGIHLISVGEDLSAASSRYLRTLYGTAPHNSFSTTETGPIGFQSDPDQEALDLYDALNHVELLDADGRPIVEPGRDGRLVVSSLYNRTLPLLRYDLGDIACWVPAAEGRRLSFVRGKKCVVFFDVAGRRWSIESFRLGSLALDGVVEYQLRQLSPSALSIDYEVARGGAPVRDSRVVAEVRALLEAHGCSLPLAISARQVASIAPDPETSKIRRVVGLGDGEPAGTSAPAPSMTELRTHHH